MTKHYLPQNYAYPDKTDIVHQNDIIWSRQLGRWERATDKAIGKRIGRSVVARRVVPKLTRSDYRRRAKEKKRALTALQTPSIEQS